MTNLAQVFFQSAGFFYLIALAATFLPGRWTFIARILLLPALVCNLISIVLRYYRAWPMLPMHLGAIALPFCLGLLLFFWGSGVDSTRHRLQRIGLVLALSLVVAAILFPKDFYLPFLKSRTLFSHAFLWFSLFAKASCLLSGAWALCAWPFPPASSQDLRPTAILQQAMGWAALGFGLWSLSMFCGELWCYLGWGSPVVWEDPALTLTMAGWFFYACVLHLHLSKAWNQKVRAAFIGIGGIAVLVLTCLPDFGPFRAWVMP
nr:cytochrome c biogenesis protein CcsA [uncultured Desulfobulbus sp.]